MITICLSLYNPNILFFKELIKSLVSIQEEIETHFLIRNDGSTNSISKHKIYVSKLLKSYEWIDGENIGVNESFIFLSSLTKTKYVAFCDQDDIWKSKKIVNAIKLLESTKKKVYC